jgi:integrin-linked kinase-associated serine/threonine phosphatase 2C
LINIGVTRAIGDVYFKDDAFTDGKPSGLIAEPEVNCIKIEKNDLFILVGTDGR